MIKYKVEKGITNYHILKKVNKEYWEVVACRKHFKGANKELKRLKNELERFGEEYVQNNR